MGGFVGTSQAYSVGGNIQLTYASLEKTVGDATGVSRMWSEQYAVSLSSPILDPRFLNLSASVNYSRNHPYGSPTLSMTTYNMNAFFFPRRQISWNLFNAKTIANVPSIGANGGYDIVTTTYGGTMTLALSKGIGRRNSNTNNYFNNSYNNWNNNNNNNNNGGRRTRLQLPDITLNATHIDALSQNTQAAVHETRDNAGANLFYKASPTTTVRLEEKTEKYNNLLSGMTYDLNTMDLYSTTNIVSSAILELVGRHSDRRFGQAASAGRTHTEGASYEAMLNMQGKGRLRHNYRYAYGDYKAPGSESITQSANANMSYGLLSWASFYGSAYANQSEVVTAATGTFPEQRSEVDSGGFSAGADAGFSREYRPEFLSPFVLRTTYRFNTGLTAVSASGLNSSGDGWQYTNNAGLGLFSTGWKKESLDSEYNYTNTRDHSPIQSNIERQTFRLSFTTTRIPYSDLRAFVNYAVAESTSTSVISLTNAAADANATESRSLSYSVVFNHAVASWLKLAMQAAQQKNSTSSAIYSLATATTTVTPESISRQAGATLTANYSLSRHISLRGSAAVEWQKQLPGGAESTTYSQTAGLSWQVRQINILGEWTRSEAIPDSGLRSEQQRLFVSASRPF